MMVEEAKTEEVKKIAVHFRVPFLEMVKPGTDKSTVEFLDSFPTPRAVKTHLSFRLVSRWLVEDKLKTIVTTRNPKDTLVSHFHFYQNIKGKFTCVTACTNTIM